MQWSGGTSLWFSEFRAYKAQEMSGEVVYALGRQPAVLRTFSQKLTRGFNDAVNGFVDDGWSVLGSVDGIEDVTIATNSIKKTLGNVSIPDGVICAKASMLLQLCSGLDENAIGASFQLVFAPIDELFRDDVPLLPSGFRVIPLSSKSKVLNPNPTLVFGYKKASGLEIGSATNRINGQTSPNECNSRSVLTIAFQFPYQFHLQESVAAMARQYVRSIISSVQRVSMAITTSPSTCISGGRLLLRSPEAVTLARWICRSYKYVTF